MSVLNRYRKSLVLTVDKTKEEFIKAISAEINGLTFTDNEAKVTFKPSFFDPFAPRGVIYLKLNETNYQDKTAIHCELVPTPKNPEGIYFLIFGLSMFSIIGLIISFSFYAFLTIALGWIAFTIVLHLWFLLEIGKMEAFLRFKVNSIKNVRIKNIA